ncbi:MAG: AMP-binding protein [Algiphilus sp.]
MTLEGDDFIDPTGWAVRMNTSLAQQYRTAGYWRDDTIWEAAVAMAERDPNRVTHHFEDTICKAGEVVDQARRLAAAMQELGLGQGDVVAFQLPNWFETLIIDLACARMGIVVVPIIPIYRDAELRFMLADCGARAIFVPGTPYRGMDYKAMVQGLSDDLPGLEWVIGVRGENGDPYSYEQLVDRAAPDDASLPEVDAEHIKMVLYTSGTTGKPKAVLHSHNTIACVVREAYTRWDQGDGDTMLMASPVTHITGFGALELPFLIGMRSVFMERWDPDAAVKHIERENVTMSMGATPFLKELLDASESAGSDLASLRRFACGGAEVPPELIRRAWRQWSQCRAFRVYGSSEAPLVTLGFTAEDEEDLAATTDGAIGLYEVVIQNDQGRRLADGEDGEICVRGAPLFLGYRNPEHTADSFDSGGYFHTGDIGHSTRDNALAITGRKKDLINRGGEKISAKEVEDVLDTHPAVKEVAVVATPHPRLGEGVCACVIAAGEESPALDALVAHCREAGIAKQKYPEAVVVLDDFPRTPSGKIRKDKLRADERVKQALQPQTA